MSCLASNWITWFAPRSNMTAPSSHGITRPLNSIIDVPALIGRAANNPMPLIGDLRFCHSRLRRCNLISSSRSFIDRLRLWIGSVPSIRLCACSYHFVIAVWSAKETKSPTRVRYWEIIADNLGKAGWSWAATQPWILAGQRSSLLTHIATTGGISQTA
jgi:hypothetical protein